MSREIDYIRSTSAIRERCRFIYDYVKSGKSQYWRLNEENMSKAASEVYSVTRACYPDFDVPYHSRWRHFMADGVDLWEQWSEKFADSMEKQRSAYALAIISVLVDAGAGMQWSYKKGQKTYSKSEGLALASFDLFTSIETASAKSLKA